MLTLAEQYLQDRVPVFPAIVHRQCFPLCCHRIPDRRTKERKIGFFWGRGRFQISAHHNKDHIKAGSRQYRYRIRDRCNLQKSIFKKLFCHIGPTSLKVPLPPGRIPPSGRTSAQMKILAGPSETPTWTRDEADM